MMIIIIFVYFLDLINNHELLCSQCKTKIGLVGDIINVKSSASLGNSEKKYFDKNNILSHTFKNPSNFYFELITLKNANLICDSVGHEEFTFFPGYAWSSCVCPQCRIHHGWYFNRINKYCELDEERLSIEYSCSNLVSFLGVSTENLQSNNYEVI